MANNTKNLEIEVVNFDRNFFPQYIRNFFDLQQINILEIGSYEGNYAKCIYETFKNCMLYLVDTWDASDTDFFYTNKKDLMGKAYEEINKKFKNIENVKIIKSNSKVAYDQFSDNFFDWIYIDADHTYHGAKCDMIKYYNKLKVGGIFSGHDWDVDKNLDCAAMFGVQEAVIEFANSLTQKIYITNEPCHKSWFFKKEV